VSTSGQDASAGLSAPLPDPLPEIAARVNGHPIPTRNVRIIAEGESNTGLVADELPRAYRLALRQLVTRELLFQEALARRLEPDSAEIEKAYNEARVQHKDEAAWAAFLAQKTMDDQSFKAELRVRFTVEALIAQATAEMPAVSEQEARDYYGSHPERFETGERLLASHILLRVSQDAGAEQRAELRQKAEDLLAQLRAGADFEELAREHSDDIGSKGRGGRLQLFGKGDLAPAFEKAAYALEPDELSEVVETPFGLHIIKLHERVPSRKLSFEEVDERIQQALLAQKHRQAIAKLVASLQSRARIELFL
jgi:parvulin-like peptidyl-prolyl isomerase